jgi:D-arginine dehydrogenase
VVVVGAGIAGASVAFALVEARPVVLLEREAQPGYHSTGRSAAMLTETYGTTAVRALAMGSRAFFETPPPGFSAAPLLTPRGLLHLAGPGQDAAFEHAIALAGASGATTRRLDQADVLAQVPILDPASVVAGLLEPGARAIDVDALHRGFLRGIGARGGRVVTDAEVRTIRRTAAGWSIDTRAGGFEADVLVNAAGAWADELAVAAGIAPIGLVPKRRTAVLLDPPGGLDPSGWPMVIDVEETFYFKPEGGRLMLSPADETPVPPQDVQPEELDVAIAVDRFEHATGRPVAEIGRSWAGLRSFVADEGPVLGPEPADPAFVWAAALGGFGIMTAPAVGEIVAALIVSGEVPARFRAVADQIGPARLAPQARVVSA